MSDSAVVTLIMGIAGMIFYAGGYIHLTRNHLAHLQTAVDKMDRRLHEIEIMLAETLAARAKE